LALTMVEVDGVSYRDAAEALGIRLENLKMVIFRGRRKIFRGMEQSLGDIGASAADGSGKDAVPKGRRSGGTGQDRRNFGRTAASAETPRDLGTAPI
jgi:hypothetical protein